MSYVCSDIVQVWKVSEAMRQKWRCPVCKALPSSAVYISLMFQWIIWIQRHDEQDLIWPKGDVRKWSCGSKRGCPVCKALQRVFHQPPMSGRQVRKEANLPKVTNWIWSRLNKINEQLLTKIQNGRRGLGIGRTSWAEGCSRFWFPAKRCGSDHQPSLSGE